MFRTVLTSLLAVLVLCGSAFAAEKTLIAAANPTWPPMEFLDENKNIIGYDRDIIAAIAEEIGMKSEFRNIAWDGIFASLESGVQRNGVLRPGHRERAPVGDGFGLCGHRRKEHRRRQRGSGKELPTVRETCHRCTPYELALPWQRVGRTQGLRGWKRPCPNGASTLPSRATTLPRTTVQTGSPTPSSPSKAENGLRYRRE